MKYRIIEYEFQEKGSLFYPEGQTDDSAEWHVVGNGPYHTIEEAKKAIDKIIHAAPSPKKIIHNYP